MRKDSSDGRQQREVRDLSVLAWIIVGIVGGWLAKTVVPEEGAGGVLADLVVGVIGALISGWIFFFFSHPGPSNLNVGSMVIAFVGAVVSLRTLRLLTSNRARVYSMIEFRQ